MKYSIILLSSLILLLSNSIYSQNKIDSTTTISIIGVGDIMPGTNFPSEKYLPPNNNCDSLFSNVKDILSNSNLTIGNLEGCFSDTAELVKRCKDSTKCYAFRIPTAFAPCLKNTGFDVLTIANNHSGDFGDVGRETTVKLLDSLNIYHAGWVRYPTSIFKKDSITYGIAAFAPNTGTVSIYDTIEAKAIISNLADSCDIVIATFHGGAEGSKYQHVTRETEEFYGENRGNVYYFSRALINAGADIVFGHGPHVSRAIDLYKKHFIAYSLGNFCTYGRFNLRGPNALAPIMKIEIDKNGNFISGKIISTKQTGRGGNNIIDTNNNAAKIIKELTKIDIPESKLSINDDGDIIYIE
jgi:poly-gamma-glutamate capsule biosynthesis protein CapA/YwtB (metallophosphatase superfamily)